MRFSMQRCGLVLCFLLFVSTQAFAAERYISDVLIVTLRDSPSANSSIIGHLRSGDYMTELEELESGYIRVRLNSGVEGWLPKKYTAVGQSKDSLIAELQKRILALEEDNKMQKIKNTDLEGQVGSFQTSIDTSANREAVLQAKLVDMEKIAADAQDKYITLQDQSKGVEAIYVERNQLIQANESLTKQVTGLTNNNRELDQTKNIFWFLTGSGVLLVGWLIGRSGRKNRRSSLSL